MAPDAPRSRPGPGHYVCPSCHLYLVAWDGPTKTVEIFHKVGLWEEFGTRHVRLICQSCLGATERVPQALVDLLRERYGLGPTPERRPPTVEP
ncbi:MAG TPA: hypothetical protein VGW35_25610 [Methylomirabilota bacterium]|nr:hypothetical protein [Methylomirabilota bacterium]